jgi:hypothetical protein
VYQFAGGYLTLASVPATVGKTSVTNFLSLGVSRIPKLRNRRSVCLETISKLPEKFIGYVVEPAREA